MKKITAPAALSCILLLVSAAAVFGQNKINKKPINIIPVQAVRVETLEQQIGRIARAYGLDARLFQSLIYTESVFKIRAVSGKGAACYTQLMPSTARRFGLRVDAAVDERFNAEKCLTAGAYYLAWLMKTFRGDVRLALAGYNAGEGAVMKFGWRVPPYKETVQYVEKICNLYYGQAGHAIAMAYNQPLAAGWVNALYSSSSSRRGNRVQNTAFVRAAGQPPQPANAALSANQNADFFVGSGKKANDSKKPVVTRIIVEEDAASPRINTQSLSFGNK